MKSRVSDNALNYLRDELEVTVDRIQQSLEAYSEFTEDASELRVANEYLDQLRGVFTMMALEEGAQIADEMRRVSEAICDESLESIALGRDALLKAALLLPPYLEALSTGPRKEDTLNLQRSVDELRQVRGEERTGAKLAAQSDCGDFEDPVVVRRLRPSFQRALTSVFRGQEVPAQLARVDEVVCALREMAQGETAYHLWWSCSKLVFALRQGRAQLGPDMLRLLGGMDRQIKHLIDIGENGFDVGEVDEFVHRVEETLRDSGATEILQDRSDYFPPVAGSAPPRPDRETLRQIAANVAEDITLVQDAVDRLANGDVPDRNSRDAILERLHASAGVMSMLNMTSSAKLLSDQCKAIGDADQLDRDQLEQLAADLVVVEDAISGLLNPRLSRGFAGQLLAKAEHASPVSQLKTAAARFAVIDQAIEDMRHVHDLAVSFDWTQAGEGWRQLTPMLHRVANVFSMLGDELASGLADRVLTLTQHPGLTSVLAENPDSMSALAEAIIGIEIYLEESGPGHTDYDIHLAHTERRLGELEDQLGITAATGESEQGAGLEAGVDDDASAAALDADSPIDSVMPTDFEGVSDWFGVDDLTFDDVTDSDDAALGIGAAGPDSLIERVDEAYGFNPGRVDDGVNECDPNALEKAESDAQTEPHAVAEDIDSSVDFDPATANVILFEDSLPPIAESDDAGSAGSDQAEDTSASEVTEDDLTLSSGTDPVALLNAQQTEQDHAPVEDIAQLQADLPHSAAPAAEPGADQGAEEVWADHEFLDIFLEEADGELEQLRSGFPAWVANTDDLEGLQAIRRSFHTLKGSGRMVGAFKSGDFAWAIEDLLNRVLDLRVPVSAQLTGLLGECIEAYSGLIDEMKLGRPGGCVQALQDRIESHVAGSEDETTTAAHDGPSTAVDESETAPEAATTEAATTEAATPEAVTAQLEEASRLPATIGQLQTLAESFESAGDDANAFLEGLLDFRTEAEPGSFRPALELLDTLEACLRAALATGHTISESGQALLRQAVVQADALTNNGTQCEATSAASDALIQRLLDFGDELAGSASGSLAGDEPEPAAEALTIQPESALDPELAEIFVQEGADILDSADVILDRWSREPDNPDLLADLRREMHTLKGSSRMAGFLVIGDLAHAVESLLDDISRGRVAFTEPMGEILQRALDGFHGMLAIARDLNQPAPAHALIDELARCAQAPSVAARGNKSPQIVEPSVDRSPEPQRSASADAVMLVPEAPDMVRVSVDLLDNIADQMGESSIYRARIQQSITTYDFQLQEMDQVVGRMSEKLRRLEIETEAQILFRYERGGDDQFEEFDPLELDRFSELQQLSRSLMEVVNDLGSIRHTLDDQTRQLEALLHQQGKINHEIQEGLSRTRMVRFDSIVPRMRRVVRQSADELGKRTELHLDGGGEMERSLLEHVVAPMEHILRNAVAHGIEDPESRAAAGKPELGRIALDMRREGSEMVLSIRDDGGGINFDAVRRKAEKSGLLAPGAEATRQQLIDCLMQPGFSTADQVNQVAGRGVGMDVVTESVRSAGGSLSVESEPGLGTTFVIRLPFSLSVAQTLLFTAGGETFAAPLAGVESMSRLEPEEVRAYLENGRGFVNVAGLDYEIHSLGALLGGSAPQAEDLDRHLPAMLIRSEGMNVALQVDQVLGSEEVVVKPVGPQVNSVPGVSGATILGDGRVVLLLETAALLRNFVGRRSDTEAAAIRQALQGTAETPLKIMVIDDSITMRKVTSRLLERHGIDAVLAKDGLDAAGQLEDLVPDAVVLDIEMPRMDGFELAAHIRNQEHLWHLPIIMVTSRSGDKHRQRAMDLGVNAYLGKPYREEELLAALRQVLGPRGERLAVQ